MIQDKDYLLRMIKQLSEALQHFLLGNNEGDPVELELMISKALKDAFGIDEETISSFPLDKIKELVMDQPPEYILLLGHYFYKKYTKDNTKESAEKAKFLYTIWQDKSQIFSFEIRNRIQEL